jgi:hypothetical protein
VPRSSDQRDIFRVDRNRAEPLIPNMYHSQAIPLKRNLLPQLATNESPVLGYVAILVQDFKLPLCPVDQPRRILSSAVE